MNFISLEYGVFFAIFFCVYWSINHLNLKLQNLFILLASYLFYGWWDPRFLLLIFISSLVDFSIGRAMQKLEDGPLRKGLLFLSLGVNLGILGFFKYFGFFVESFKAVFCTLGPAEGFTTLDIILPVGISFYTLQTLSYTFDVYRRKIEATDDVISFFAYVSFFPQLVAGPIERAGKLLPQFQQKRHFTYARAADGLRQVGWGLFKKMVIADNAGVYGHLVFDNYTDYSASSLLLSLAIMSIQFYADFSGYSDIAIGSARIIGFDLMKNFDYPFFARTIPEFWRKWHISLITWFQDYIMAWLKGFSKPKLMRNIFIVFIVTGLWHGPAWHFIAWGFLHAVFFIPTIFGKRRKFRHSVGYNRVLPSLEELFLMSRTFLIFALIGTFFRANTVMEGFARIGYMVDVSIFSLPKLPESELLFILPLFAVEWWQRSEEHGLDFSNRQIPTYLRWLIYLILVVCTLLYSAGTTDFIYFQF